MKNVPVILVQEISKDGRTQWYQLDWLPCDAHFLDGLQAVLWLEAHEGAFVVSA